IINNKNETEKLKKSKEEKELKLKDIATLEIKKVELEKQKEDKTKILDDIRTILNTIKNHTNTCLAHQSKYKEYIAFEQKYKSSKIDYETKDDLYKKEQAGILASQLQENRPCPVCGSTNHPNKASIKNDIEVPSKEELKIIKD